jgi:hypothetical protein
MAQGLTSDAGIAVMETRDSKLINQQTFLVTVTRLRDALTLVVDRASALERQLVRNPGGKSSALETTGKLRDLTAAASGLPKSDGKNRTDLDKSLEPGAGPKPFEIGI